MNVNSVTIIGNLTRDPELKTVGETSICELGVAVNERQKQNGVWEEVPSFFDVTVFGGQAESCSRYLAKGRQVGIQGRLRQERWEKDGQNRSKVKIIANVVQFIGPRDDAVVGNGGGATAEPVAAAGADDDSDIPF